ncbi:hypothetical protein F4778DRAFT_799354 [Xylariomycetidae sp. FL2044]|nr:hypothetical protein F4778DRAFT_799354 [Xylariomycetidae sp. FL2044]
MRFAPTILFGASLASLFGAVVSSPLERRALSFGHADAPLKLSRGIITRRGEEYDDDRLDELEEETEDASKDDVYKGIDYLVDLFKKQNIKYGLMGGVALQLYGNDDRETHDSDMVVDVNSKDLLDKVKDDDKISRPRPLMAASGTARLFIKIDDDKYVAADVFVKGADNAPALETQEKGGYNVLKLGPLIGSKIGRAEDKDNEDILWLIKEKKDEVKDAADGIKKDKRIQWARDMIEDDDDDKDAILEAFKLENGDVEDDDDEDDD